MYTIAIIGAGRVGTALAKILLSTTDFQIELIDISSDALVQAEISLRTVERSEFQQAMEPTEPIQLFRALAWEDVETRVHEIKPFAIACCVPFFQTVDVAKLALAVKSNYIDFTEDEFVTDQILNLRSQIEEAKLTFVPQTGLAPGLVSYVGLSLFAELDEPKELSLRVGALPRVSLDEHRYAITWSVDGLINEYSHPCRLKRDGLTVQVDSMDEAERLSVDGIEYEAFTTSGGVGMLEAYDGIPTVGYKTIRYPGHLEFLQRFFGVGTFVPQLLNTNIDIARNIFKRTRDDVVVLVAQAEDTSGMTAAAGIRFYPSVDLGLTALELTTAGTGAAILEMIGRKLLPVGIVHSGQVDYEAFLSTAAANLIFNSGD